MKRLLLILFFYGVLTSNGQDKLFTLLPSRHTNIEFNNEIKETEALNVLAYEYYYNGGGVAIGDLNNDGLPDIYFTANIKANKLYLNKGEMQFEDITKKAGVEGRKNWKTGVTMADVNGDGWLDIYVCYSGKEGDRARKNELYINNRNLTFTESAKEYGLDDDGCSTQAIFFDYDIDGDLDCYVLSHNIKAYKNVELQYLKTEYDSLAADKLYRNENGKFRDVSKEAGITGNPISFGLGIAVSDINNDGWPDIYISNDYTEQDYCYINNANGTFSQKEMFMFSHMSQFSMGCEIADYNNDGLVDIFTLDMLPEDNKRQKLLQAQENYELYLEMASNGFHYQFMRNMLHLNNGNGTFSEIGQLAGISNTDWSWAPLVADLDNDGWKDLFITNGYMRDYTNRDFLKYWGDYLVKQVANRDSIRYMDIIVKMPSTQVASYAFKNNGDLTFTNTSDEWGLGYFNLANGAAYADLDRDGDLDIVVNNINAKATIYRNESRGNRFINIKLEGNGLNRFGIGAKVFCYTSNGMQLLEQVPSRGYQSSVSEILHFGMGEEVVADSIKVIWPNGRSETKFNISAGKIITFKESDAVIFVAKQNGSRAKKFSYRKPFISFSHLQIDYNDFKRQPLMPVMYSPVGPIMKSADLNGDGLADMFIGSSQGQSGSLYLQTNTGFELKEQLSFLSDTLSATTDITIFDADGDKDLDIYCVSGGYHDFDEQDIRLQDRLFLNDGKGNFVLSENALPAMLFSKSVVAPADIDKDGDIDLFVGGRVSAGKYPLSPRSYLLLNDGKGNFTDVTMEWSPPLTQAGMVTDAKWHDVDTDGRPDLILVGEWMEPSIYINRDNMLRYKTGLFRNEENNAVSDSLYRGWWNTLELADVDKDGDIDIIAGNWGLNSQLHATATEPVELYYKDFDNNGSIDPFLCCYIQERSYPYISRDELLDQIYPMRRKFTSYQSYADATMSDIFSPSELAGSHKLSASHFETTLFENKGGIFFERKLPIEAQFSPVYKIVVEDINDDDFADLILLGNNDHPRLKIGKIDANFGTVLMNDGKGKFRFAGSSETGLVVAGEVKDAEVITIGDSRYLLIGVNNSDLLHYKINR